jgi:chromosome partitioning protein
LLIDLDAQSNLSYALATKDTLEKLRNEKKTIYHMFRSALDGQGWDIKAAITTDCSNISGNTHLSTLICTSDLGQLDEDILNMLEDGVTIEVDFRRILKEHLAKIQEEFEWVIIDCPPSLPTLTSNAIIASDYFIAPILPEYLSLEGLNLVQRRIGELIRRYGDEIAIDFAGCILNKVDIRRRDHISKAEDVYDQAGHYEPFNNWVGDIKPLYIITEYGYPFLLSIQGE